MARVAILFAFLSAAGPVFGAERTRPSVPITVDGHGAIFIDVSVNATGPYRFVLDTGASRSIVSETLSREIGAPQVARSEVVTSAGSEFHPVVRVASVAIAPVHVDDLLTPVVPDARLASLGPGVRGLLGQDFLSGFNYTLDYRRARLTWDAGGTCDVAGAVPMVAAEGRFVMALVSDGGMPLRLVPDSGAEVPVLFSATRPTRAMEPLPRLRVGPRTLDRVDAYVVERRDPHADGLLPLHHFSSVSFSQGGGCVLAR